MNAMKSTTKSTLSEELASRKKDHIDLAGEAQTLAREIDSRFNYEPLFFKHVAADDKWEISFLKHKLHFPVWVSSMTGGTSHAKVINQNLAQLVGKYKLGMGLGSCRSLLHANDRLEDFKVRKFLGDQPFFANIGFAQLAELKAQNNLLALHEMVKKVEATGLIIHLNPLQEWFQPEGDRFKVSPLDILKNFLEEASYPVLIKEVGQGMGPKSLKALLELPIAGIELGAFGGTNFSLLESKRGTEIDQKMPFIQVGHTASEMISFLNALPKRDKEIIISGGIKNALDGYYLISTLKSNALIGMAQPFLGPAMESFEALETYFLNFKEALLTARALLTVKGE
jgi:isopentenyl-diphosphate Delta-isomerase